MYIESKGSRSRFYSRGFRIRVFRVQIKVTHWGCIRVQSLSHKSSMVEVLKSKDWSGALQDHKVRLN